MALTAEAARNADNLLDWYIERMAKLDKEAEHGLTVDIVNDRNETKHDLVTLMSTLCVLDGITDEPEQPRGCGCGRCGR